MDKVRIYFLGSGPFAVPVLQHLLKSDKVEIVKIITQVDKPAGRKKLLTPTPVGIWCDANSIGCKRVKSVNREEFHEEARKDMVDIFVVVSFGQLLKEPTLALPRICCLNVHASLLPAYRGASPIISAILAGEEKTGVTFMLMDKGLDTGDMLETWEMPIDEKITGEELEEALAKYAGSHLADCIVKTAAGELKGIPQDHSRATHTCKIRKSDGAILWSSPAKEILRKVRAFHQWPTAFFFFIRQEGAGKMLVKLTEAELEAFEGTLPPAGTITSVDKKGFLVACGTGVIRIKKVIPEGKKEMTGADFARGQHLQAGMTVSDGIQ
ncbi:MAG: methionyl-tRNA formyltransferase [Lentisphaeria bacterium]|nr:methionyl-tRNA formyltransferase [Lentisphaeria bacterium]